MVNESDYQRAGVPTRLLGLTYLVWTRADLRVILDHYDQEYRRQASKLELMTALNTLIIERGLDRNDRISILSAWHSGENLPPLRPILNPPVQESRPTGPATRKNVQDLFSAHVVRHRARRAEYIARRAQRRATHALNWSFLQSLHNENEQPDNPGPVPARASKSYSNTEERVEAPQCNVCYETLDANNTPQQRITSTCQHEPDVCSQCLTTSINTQFSDNVWDQIQCPTCRERLGYHDMQIFAEKQTFERYDKFSLEACLNGSHFQYCRHPGCTSGQQCFPEEDSYIICRDCDGRTCIKCDTIWHPGESCAEMAAKRQAAEAQNKQEQEQASLKYIRTETKTCPGCHAPTQRYAGCDHITCRRCNHQYCWLCYADYLEIVRSGNSHHREDCKYHTTNLPNLPPNIGMLPLGPLATHRNPPGIAMPVIDEDLPDDNDDIPAVDEDDEDI